MAIDGELKTHERTYSGFTRLFKVGTIISVIAAAFVVLLIAN